MYKSGFNLSFFTPLCYKLLEKNTFLFSLEYKRIHFLKTSIQYFKLYFSVSTDIYLIEIINNRQ